MKGGRRVVAVDILQQNIDFVKTSLSMMGISGTVEFVLNAISDKYETLYPVFEVEGNGGSSKAGLEKSSSFKNILKLSNALQAAKHPKNSLSTKKTSLVRP